MNTEVRGRSLFALFFAGVGVGMVASSSETLLQELGALPALIEVLAGITFLAAIALITVIASVRRAIVGFARATEDRFAELDAQVAELRRHNVRSIDSRIHRRSDPTAPNKAPTRPPEEPHV